MMTDEPIPPTPEETDAPAAAAEPTNPPELNAKSAKIVVKRSGAETDIEFPVHPPTMIGRFDPSIGPIDVDLGTLPEGQYISRKHAKGAACCTTFAAQSGAGSPGFDRSGHKAGQTH